MTLYRWYVVVVVIAAGLLFFYRQQQHENEDHLISETHAPTRSISVLFLGNSYTYVNNLPKMVIDVASSDPENHTEIRAQSITQGGATLADLWKRDDVRSTIASHHWDYVVLQNQSEWALVPDVLKASDDIAPQFADAIRAAGGTPVLYLTWARAPGSNWYTNASTSFLQNPDYMQAQLHYYTEAMASQIHASLLPAGDCWKFVLDTNPSLHLYQEDNSHPSPAGTYLVALMFYHFLTGRPIDQVSYLPEGTYITGGTAETTYTADGTAIKALLPQCSEY